jgi:polyribonucleotide nucleotidyltransferase
MNKEESREYYKKYREKNKESLNNYSREYYSKNKDTKIREYLKENKEKINKQQKEYSCKNEVKERRREIQKNYYYNNTEKRKDCINSYHKRLKDAIFDILGRKCVHCGFSDMRALQLDHVNGGGGKERKINNGQIRYLMILKKLAEDSKEYQILCANCNWIKRHINNEVRK